MKKYIVIIPVVMAIMMSGCYLGPCIDGYGPVAGQERELSDFTAVSNTTSFEVRVTVADTFSVLVEAQENLLGIIETYVSGNSLIVKVKNGVCFNDHVPTVVYVTMPVIEEIRNTGSGRLSADRAVCNHFEMLNSGSGMIRIDTIRAGTAILKNTGSGSVAALDTEVDGLEVENSGSGEVDAGYINRPPELSINHTSSGRIYATVARGGELDVKLTGSGRIEMYGEADYANLELTSSGKIDGLDLTVIDADARNTGSGKIFIHAIETLDVVLTGSGDVLYLGNPQVSVIGSGSGSVRPY